jgi:redox-sensitive bicupin YhaK (pirin superfamily)
MITVRHSHERGRSYAGWLDSRHTFSFAGFHDPAHMGFGALRVINDDWVNAGAGFGDHPHRDMEILSYVLSGALAHKDNMGNGSTIGPGDVQRMSAGTGVVHSEWNHSKSERVHFLQIWIVPEKRGLEPGYEQRTFDPRQLHDRLALIASRDGRDGSLTIHQDVALYATKLSEGKSVEYEVKPGRRVWVQVANGSITLSGTALDAGDGAAVTDESKLALHGMKDAEVLVFDLA